MVDAYVRRQRYKPQVRYVGDRGWQMPVKGMYERRYDRDVYGTVIRQAGPATFGRWYWMLYVKGGPELASGYSNATTSVEARSMTNNAWYNYQRRLGTEGWPPPEDSRWRMGHD